MGEKEEGEENVTAHTPCEVNLDQKGSMKNVRSPTAQRQHAEVIIKPGNVCPSTPPLLLWESESQ